MHLIAGTNLNDIADLRVEAERIVVAWLPAVYNQVIIYGWGIRLADGTVFYQENFGSAGVGTHGHTTGEPDVYSKTITFTGQGNAVTPGACKGQFRFEFFVGNSYSYPKGLKKLHSADDTDLAAFQHAFDISTYGPADFFGQQGDFRTSYPVQYNGHTQKHLGT